jgi:putative ABC transport system ATP-binding protein
MIALDRLARVFQVGDQRVHALAGVSLEVAAGEYVSIMGPSGSGKSTLLHILGLLDRPTTGTYRLQGRDVTGLDDAAQAALRRDAIGFVFQFFHLVPHLTAAENVELPMTLAAQPPAERRERMDAALRAMGIADRARHRPDQLSGGQRQRVAIARATVMRPALLLADEPTGNLDRRSGTDVLHILERLNADGLTLIIVTHDPEIGERARRRIRMVDGLVAEDRGRDEDRREAP